MSNNWHINPILHDEGRGKEWPYGSGSRWIVCTLVLSIAILEGMNESWLTAITVIENESIENEAVVKMNKLS